MGFYATVFWNDYSWNDFSEVLKLKQKIDIETITIFMKHRPGDQPKRSPVLSSGTMFSQLVKAPTTRRHGMDFMGHLRSF